LDLKKKKVDTVDEETVDRNGHSGQELKRFWILDAGF
jgi:hypothetical protein